MTIAPPDDHNYQAPLIRYWGSARQRARSGTKIDIQTQLAVESLFKHRGLLPDLSLPENQDFRGTPVEKALSIAQEITKPVIIGRTVSRMHFLIESGFNLLICYPTALVK